MKQLILLRHAKSDWGTEFLKDQDRHLSERGYADAYHMSSWFEKTQPVPDLIITSTAVRAYNTATIFARAMEFNFDNLKLEEKIYETSVSRLLSVIQEQDNKTNSILIVGHNPAFTDVCAALSDDLYFDNVPTCGIISFSFDIRSWRDIGKVKGTINFHQFPKNFKNQD